jgi:hypothetical protein
MPPRYARPRLISSDDKRYRAYVQQFLIQRSNQKAMRPPRQRDLFGGQAENALRDWLSEMYTLSERRILEYEERKGRGASTKYRELDALVLDDDNRHASVYEIKASRTAGAVRRAMGQLRETREILNLLYRTVDVTILLVDTGIPTAEEVEALMNGPEPPVRAPQTLEEVLESLEDVRLVSSLEERDSSNTHFSLMRFSVDDIIALVGAENLALDWEADELEPEEEPEARPTSSLFSSSSDEDEDDNDNPFAAALRKAGIRSDD